MRAPSGGVYIGLTRIDTDKMRTDSYQGDCTDPTPVSPPVVLVYYY